MVGDIVADKYTTPEEIEAAYNIGDGIMTYDKIGNITTLLRYLVSSQLGAINEIEHFNYNYQAGNNRLTQVAGLYGTTTRNYTYDANGNLLSDDFRKLNNTVYDRAAYAYHINKTDSDGIRQK